MASTASQTSRELPGFGFRALAAACVPGGTAGGGLFADKDRNARAYAGAGLAALVALPMLLVLSAVVGSPLAIPAILGLGYLALSRADARDDRRRANIIGGAVLAGLVGWLLALPLLGDGFTTSDLIGALLIPLFAAAPALARTLQSAWTAPAALRRTRDADLRAIALERVAGLDELAPGECVLLLDPEGNVLAATAAARAALGLLPEGFEHHLGSFCQPQEVARVLDALHRCAEGSGPVDLGAIDAASEAGPARSPSALASQSCPLRVATLSPCRAGIVAMRFRDRAPRAISPCHAPSAAAEDSADVQGAGPPGQACDIGEALAFVLRCAEPKARARDIALTLAVEPGSIAACDRQVARRILRHLVDIALNANRGGGAARITARRVKGVVLISSTSYYPTRSAADAEEAEGRIDVATMRALVESVGGTLVAVANGSDITLNMRLAAAMSGTVRMHEGDGVGGG